MFSDEELAQLDAYYEANKDAVQARLDSYRKNYSKNHKKPYGPANAEYGKRYRQEHKGQVNAHAAKRRAAKRNATPTWADHSAIKALYIQAAFLTDVIGEPYHVDHIVPLQSDIVCGLHCEQNMQILECTHNIRKGNRNWPDMP